MDYKDLNPIWIKEPITPEVVDWTSSFAYFLAKRGNPGALTTSQIRKFFGQLKRIQADFKNLNSEIPRLRPRLAYAVGRDKNSRGDNKTKIKEFYNELDKAMRNLDTKSEQEFNNFVALVESIVAFHKFHGGD